MTISNTSRTAGPFAGNGTAKQFSFSFKVFSRSDLLVARTIVSTGIESTLLLDTDYTVTLNGNQNSNPGGVITLGIALPVGTTLAATSNLPIQQNLDLTNNGGFYPAAINDALDRIVITVQQLAAKVGAGSLNIGAAAAITAVLSFISNVAGSAGSSLLGFIQSGAGAVLRTVEDKLRDTVNVKDFGALGNYNGSEGADDSAAFRKAIATGRPIRLPPNSNFLIASSIQTDLEDVVLLGSGIGVKGSYISSTVPSGHVFVLGTEAVPGKGGLRIRDIAFKRISGTTSCLKVVENLGFVVGGCSFNGFTDYFLEAYKSDGGIIKGNISIFGSLKAASEMDRLVIRENDIQAAANHPGIEVYGGAAIVIEKNFVNWGNHEAIVLGYDSARGDFPQAPTVRNNYLERNCQADLAGAKRPYLHIGKPVDQNGAAYLGTDLVRWVDVRSNYFNGDVNNANLANIMPALFERVVEGNWGSNRVLNFISGGADALHPRVKFPAKAIRTDNMNTRFVDISTGGPSAYQQCTYPATSMYRSVEFYLGTISVPTDTGGSGQYNFVNIGTGVLSLDTGRMIITATPSKDCRTFVDSKTVSAASDTDGSDRVSWRINVAGAAVSSSVDVTVRAIVTIPI